MTLRSLTPEAVAAEAEHLALHVLEQLRVDGDRTADHAGRIAFALSPGYDVRVVAARIEIGPCRGGTDLGLTAAALCRYAKTGLGWPDVPEGDEEQAQAAEDALLSLVGALEGPGDATPDAWQREQDDGALATVARAALARISLARGLDVQRAHLAALAGVSAQRVRTLIAEGVLSAREVERGRQQERERSPITYASAHQWLRARDPATETTGALGRRE